MNHSFALNLSCPINNADRCQLQRYVQSDIMLDCSSPVVARLKSRASSIPGELILRASAWLWPGITSCVKTREIETPRELHSSVRFQS
jgi:hypothetical protein